MFSLTVACSIEMPAAGLASTRSQKLPRSSSDADSGYTRGSAAAAMVMLARAPTLAPTKPRGLTPTIVTGTPPIVSVPPTASGRFGELPLPVAMADHGHQRSAGLVVCAGEEPAGCRIQTQGFVVGPSDDRSLHLGHRSGRADREGPATEPGRRREDVAALRERASDRVREVRRGTSLLSHLDEHQLPRVAHRQHPEHQRIDQAEDRRVGADAQSEREHDDHREGAIPEGHPHGVAQIPSDLVEPPAMPPRTNAFFRLLHAAELQEGEAPRLVRRHAIAHLIRGGHVDERLQFVVQIALGPISRDDSAHDGGEAMQKRHAPSRTLVTATDTRSQRSRCCSSCRRPAAVSR